MTSNRRINVNYKRNGCCVFADLVNLSAACVTHRAVQQFAIDRFYIVESYNTYANA